VISALERAFSFGQGYLDHERTVLADYGNVCAPDGLRDQLRSLTRMQLVRTLAAWRPDLTAYRDLDSAYRIGLKFPGPPVPRTAR
jgi:hypothetical protein